VRNTEVLQKVLRLLSEDWANLGMKSVIKCLIKTHAIFERADGRHIVNKLWIDDLVDWIQMPELFD